MERETRPAIPPAEAPDELRPALEKALDGLPEEKQAEILSVVRVRFRFFQGPLPPPDDLKSYEEARPGCADRIIDWADRSLAHEHDAERRRGQTDDKLLLRGQLLAFAAALAALIGGCVLVALGSPIVGSILSIGSLVGCAALYIRGEFDHRQNSEKERQ